MNGSSKWIESASASRHLRFDALSRPDSNLRVGQRMYSIVHPRDYRNKIPNYVGAEHDTETFMTLMQLMTLLQLMRPPP
jgi:hypothetical protein